MSLTSKTPVMARLRLLMVLFALLCLGGLVEYLGVAIFHSQWTPPRPYSWNSKEKGLSGVGYKRYLERIGKETMSALQAGGVSNRTEGEISNNDPFYERRQYLLNRIDEKISHVRLLHDQLSSKTGHPDINGHENRGYKRVEYFDDGLQQLDKYRQGQFQEPDMVTESPYGPEVLVENDSSLVSRELSRDEAVGNNILLTLRTIQKYHNDRLPLLFDTWLSKVNKSNVFLMTDGKDSTWQRRVWNEGMHYVLTACGSHKDRESMLCCRTGTEMAQIFKPGNNHYDWLCHVDDDMYVRLPPLIQLLSYFDPKKDSIYLGRSGSEWGRPRKVLEDAKLGKGGQVYHFAVGGMYCLSRAMLELARPYLIGSRNFSRTCTQTLEPDDVTVGFVVDILLNKTLSRTEKIYTHGLHLISTVDPSTLDQQVAFSYGFGSVHWGYDDYNAIYVPEALYSIEEDESQFRSLHCHLYPEAPQCMRRAREMPKHVGMFNF